MTQTNTFGCYVQMRLDHWGREFALHRDCEYLGHQSRNLLQVLIEHRGEMPGRAQGFKPLEVDALAQQIEDIVADIARTHVDRACCLRAMYCGTGRRGVERLETARLLLATCADNARLSRGQYYTLVELGEATVYGVLMGLSRAA